MPPPIPQNNLDENVDPKLQTGNLPVGGIIAVICAIGLAICGLFFLNQLRVQQEMFVQRQHDADEAFSYKFAEMSGRYKQMKAICDDNYKNHATTVILVKRQTGKPLPPELESQKECSVVIEKEKE